MRLDGLELVTPKGVVWEWRAWRVADGGARLDVFASACRHCGRMYAVTVRLPAELGQRDTRLQLTREHMDKMHAFGLRNCPDDRWKSR